MSDEHLTAGPLTVNGKVPGEIWWTDDVLGYVEVMHIGGMTAVEPVVDAWVTIDGDRMTFGARTKQPIIDGTQRDGYWMPSMGGKISKEFPEYIQTISAISSISSGVEGRRTSMVRTATVFMDELKNCPLALSFSQVLYTLRDGWGFDVREFQAKFS